jgi:hypothetical protein
MKVDVKKTASSVQKLRLTITIIHATREAA